jgi:hypothetical protein
MSGQTHYSPPKKYNTKNNEDPRKDGIAKVVWLTWAVNLPLMSAMLVANFAIVIATPPESECYFVPDRCAPKRTVSDVPSLRYGALSKRNIF